MLAFELARESGEHPFRAHGVATLVGRGDRAPSIPPHGIGEMVLDVAPLVDLAALHEGSSPELCANRLGERLAAVDDEEHCAVRAHAPSLQVGEQSDARRRILRRALVEAERVFVAFRVDAERDQDEVLGDVLKPKTP